METGQPYGIGAYFAYRHDPLTGMPYEFAVYLGYHAQFMEVSMSWGFKGIKPDHTAILLGE